MKRLLVVFFCLMALVLNAQDKEQWIKLNGAPLQVNEKVHDFGTLTEGDKTVFEFQILNDSAAHFVITSVSTSCGCTTSSYSQRPVKQGKTATIKVGYDSSRIGVFTKMVYVYSNFCNEPIVFEIKGKINKKGEE
ncbi:MAG: DUF1573 domain-containing protein [Salinivirgaceae bacterium]|nr:DUF1573 domain-containing protein [Salinivirgaceae bacterium]